MMLIAMLAVVFCFVWKIYYSKFKKYNIQLKQLIDIIVKDYTIWSLVIVDILVTVLTLTGGRNFVDLLWVYWYQIIIVGLFMCVKVIDHKLNLGFLANFFSKLGSIITILSVYFLVAIVGAFLCFVSVGNNTSNTDELIPIFGSMFFANLFVIVILFINHTFSFIYNRKKDRELANVPNLWIFSYRILPLILGIFAITSINFKTNIIAIIIFVIMKTCLDVIGHVDEHLAMTNTDENLKVDNIQSD